MCNYKYKVRYTDCWNLKKKDLNPHPFLFQTQNPSKSIYQSPEINWMVNYHENSSLIYHSNVACLAQIISEIVILLQKFLLNIKSTVKMDDFELQGWNVLKCQIYLTRIKAVWYSLFQIKASLVDNVFSNDCFRENKLTCSRIIGDLFVSSAHLLLGMLV